MAFLKQYFNNNILLNNKLYLTIHNINYTFKHKMAFLVENFNINIFMNDLLLVLCISTVYFLINLKFKL